MFYLSVKLICITDRSFTCQCLKNLKKNFNADRCFTCQAMKFYFFPENLYFSIALTGKVPVSNTKRQPFTDYLFYSDRCFPCQWPTFYILSYCLTGVLPVSNNICYLLTGTLPVSDYFLSIDRWFTCQCHWNIVWQVIYLSMMNFNNHWQVIYLSVIKSHVFRSTDR